MEVMAMTKAVLLSTGVVSLAVMLKVSLPVVLDLLTTELNLSWFRPPYLYLIINCIILSIVASSKLQPRKEQVSVADVAAVKSAVEVEESSGGGGVVEVVAAEEVVKEVVFGYLEESDLVKEEVVKQVDVVVRKDVVDEIDGGGGEEREESGVGVAVEKEEEEECKVLKSMWTLPEDVVATGKAAVVEKPPVSARFAHRKTVKSSPEGKAGLKKVSRPKRQETLESTWRTLTEGRPMPLTRHLRKSDTFAAPQDASPPLRELKKSDTISTTAMNSSSGSGGGSSGGGRLRKEPSLSQDDLNRRVEAFIKKFNEEMRLQRQESINQYREMVDRY